MPTKPTHQVAKILSGIAIAAGASDAFVTLRSLKRQRPLVSGKASAFRGFTLNDSFMPCRQQETNKHSTLEFLDLLYQ